MFCFLLKLHGGKKTVSIEKWHEILEGFREAFGYCKPSEANLHHDMLVPRCEKAGIAFFDLIQNDDSPFDIDDEFRVPPVAEKAAYYSNQINDAQHYDHYWLCVIGHLGRNDKILVGHNKLRRTEIPVMSNKVCWLGYHHDSKIADSFFSDDKHYNTEVCRASIQACEMILQYLKHKTPQQEEWRPPEGFIGSKTIEQDYMVPRTTLQRWHNRDIGKLSPLIERDPKTRENYYPEDWVKKQVAQWKPRKKAT